MNQLILFDDPALRGGLLPFTFTRPVAEIRVGILRIREKWEKHLQLTGSFYTQDYLKTKFRHEDVPSLFINGAVCPNENLLFAIARLSPGQALWRKNTLLALHVAQPKGFSLELAKEKAPIQFDGEITLISRTWHIFQHNAQELRRDFNLITSNRLSSVINDPHVKMYNEKAIFIEEGATIRAAVL